jgi:hypothetical protein
VVPNALGVQEAAFAVLASLFGVGPELGIAASLLKRARDIVETRTGHRDRRSDFTSVAGDGRKPPVGGGQEFSEDRIGAAACGAAVMHLPAGRNSRAG